MHPLSLPNFKSEHFILIIILTVPFLVLLMYDVYTYNEARKCPKRNNVWVDIIEQYLTEKKLIQKLNPPTHAEPRYINQRLYPRGCFDPLDFFTSRPNLFVKFFMGVFRVEESNDDIYNSVCIFIA